MRDDERKAIASMSDDERKASLVSSMSLFNFTQVSPPTNASTVDNLHRFLLKHRFSIQLAVSTRVG